MTGLLPPHRILLTTDTVGGVWSYSLDLARGFARRGASVDLAILGPAPSPAQAEEAAFIALHRTNLSLEWLGSVEDVHAARDALRRLAQTLRADMVQLHSPALVGGGQWPCPVIAVAHSCVGTWWQAMRPEEPMPPDLAWRAEMMAEGLTKADAVVSPTASFAAALERAYGSQPRLTVIHNGRAAPEAMSSVKDTSGIMTAGRLWDEAKNVGLLDQVAGTTGLAIAAAGPVASPFGSAASYRHLNLLGTLSAPQMRRAFAHARLFASAARYEPFGLAVLEAAQAGLPLVLSDIPSFRELWEGCAVFLPAGDLSAWCHVLPALYEDHPRCAALGEAARRRAMRFTPEAQASASWRLHRKLLAQARGWEAAA